MKVSIITVCYNSAKTIEQTIQSVINQTYKNIEYIIIDGGSTDGTQDIIEKYEADIAYWVSEPDRGLYDAMNKGINRATGEIVGILNSDDWYTLSAVEKVVACFKIEQVDIIHGDMVTISNYSNCLIKNMPILEGNAIYFMMPYNVPTVFIRNRLYQQYGHFDCRYVVAADYDLLLRFYERGVNFTYLPELLAYFRVGGISTSKRLWRLAVEGKKISEKALANEKLGERKGRHGRHSMIKSMDQKLFNHCIDKRLVRKENHEFFKKIFKQFFKGKMQCILFGAGIIGAQFYEWCLKCDVKVHSFVDNSVKKEKRHVGTVEVNMPDALYNHRDQVMIIITIKDEHQTVAEQLDNMGFTYRRDYLFYTDIMDTIRLEYVKKKMSFIFDAPKHVCD